MEAWEEDLAYLNSLAGEVPPVMVPMPADVAGWRPAGTEIPQPPGLHGFAASDTAKTIAGWLAAARPWANPDDTDVVRMTTTTKLATHYEHILLARKFREGLLGQWEALMQLYREGSSIRPVVWAYWRYKEASGGMAPLTVFAEKTVLTKWQRAKCWEECGGLFAPRTRLYPKVSQKLVDMQRHIRVTGDWRPSEWAELREVESLQRGRIRQAFQTAWRNTNLALWLADGEALVNALRLKQHAVATV